MSTKIVPAADVLAAHEQAAAQITELRKKGIPCHLEEGRDAYGTHVEVIQDENILTDAPKPPERVMKGQRAS